MVRGLYVITDATAKDLEERVIQALLGGARVVQYRDKVHSDQERRILAERLCRRCRAAGALFIVNDSPQLALECDADGVHLGQGDIGISEARLILGRDKLIGISTRTVEQALKAEGQGADYIGLGSMYPTTTKHDAQVVGIDALHRVRRAVKVPIVAIGGIGREQAAELIAAGADAIAVISAIFQADDAALAARELALQFNAREGFPRGRVLTVAGSDSSGGAGIQADLKTITLLGSYGTSALTALTAQNTLGVRAIHPVPADFVAEQLNAILEDVGTDTLKTGMLLNADTVAVVSRAIHRHRLLSVVDPVMVAKGGAALLESQAADAVRELLLPETYLLTPNLPEAEALTGLSIGSLNDMEQAAYRLQEMGAHHVLVKGGHLSGDAVDVLLVGNKLYRFARKRVPTRNTHGTGCTYSAAIACYLAQGKPLLQAVEAAKNFITAAILSARPLGSGNGPVNHWQAAQETLSK